MSRTSASAAAFPTSRARLQPPADLNELERAEFLNLVLALPPDHFSAADLSTVSAYARAVVNERIADGELSACPVIDGKASPWLPIWMGRMRACTTLARRLRLNPAGRDERTKSAEGRQEPAPTSYYERMSLEGRRDDANGH